MRKSFICKAIFVVAIIVAYALASDAKTLDEQVESAAKLHDVDADLLRAIVAVESRGHVAAYNAQTIDYGLGQINHKTAKAYKLNAHKLLTDAQYNLNAAAQILKWFETHYKAREPQNWYCRYNVGTGPLAVKADKCQVYVIKVQMKLKAANVAKEF